jgi:hypothetical protein
LIDYLLDQTGTSRSALARVPREHPLAQLSLISPELRRAFAQLQPMNSPAIRKQSAELSAALAAVAGQFLKAAQVSLLEEIAKQLQLSPQAFAVAALAAGQPAQGARTDDNEDDGEQ